MFCQFTFLWNNLKTIWELQEHYKAFLHILQPYTPIQRHLFFLPLNLLRVHCKQNSPLHPSHLPLSVSSRCNWQNCKIFKVDGVWWFDTRIHCAPQALSDMTYLLESTGFGFASWRLTHSLDQLDGGTRHRRKSPKNQSTCPSFTWTVLEL